MKNFVKLAFIGSAALTSLAFAPATFAQDSLEIRNFVGSINWSNGLMNVEVQENEADTKITKAGGITIDGGIEKIDGSDCKSSYGSFNIDWFGKKKEGRFGGFKDLEDYPILNITLPANTKLVISDSVVFTEGAPDIGEADLDIRYCGKVSLGDVENTFALNSRGSGDVTMSRSGQIAANLRGSGDLTGGNSGDVLIQSHGSGDVDLGNLASLEASLHGSGDFEAGDVNGAAELSSRGSGDIDLNDVIGSLRYSSFGSGDLDAASVTGPEASFKSHGSGDIDIGGGAVDALDIIVRGSATAEYSGEAKTANLRSSGSGDIRVDRVSGVAEIKTSGSGDVDIDERG